MHPCRSRGLRAFPPSPRRTDLADHHSELIAAAATARSVLLVCLGNICRSPLAEGVLRHRADERGVGHLLRVESRGTGHWHVGELPDPRAREVARKNGIELTSRARLLTVDDLADFDLILGMDEQNLRSIKRLATDSGIESRPGLFRVFDPVNHADHARFADARNLHVPDPYHHGPEAFDEVFAMVDAASRGLLERMFAEP